MENAISDVVVNLGRVDLNDTLTIGGNLAPGDFLEFDFLVSSDGSSSNFAVVPEPTGLACLALLSVSCMLRRCR